MVPNCAPRGTLLNALRMIGNVDELSNQEGNPRPAKVNEYNSISRECMCINYRLRFRRIYIHIKKEKNSANNFCSFALTPRTRESKRDS